MKTPRFPLAAFLCLATLSAHAAPDPAAAKILADSGVKGGIVVQLGIGDGSLTAALRANDSYQVQGLDTDAARVAKAREAIFAKGAYGPVSVDTFDGKLLPYIDNLVNLIVADDLGGVPMAEVERVLVPNGVALIAAGRRRSRRSPQRSMSGRTITTTRRATRSRRTRRSGRRSGCSGSAVRAGRGITTACRR